MIVRFLALLLMATVARADINDTVLGRLADSLGPGEYAEMPANASLSALPMTYSLLYYADGAVWDPRTQRIQIVAGPGTCCANPAIYQRIVYDTATDAWSMEQMPLQGAHHAYDGNALDPVTGTHYFHFQVGPVYANNGSGWIALPALPWSPTSPVTGASLSWFPDAYGGQGALVYAAPAGRVAVYHGGAWTIIPVPSWGSAKIATEYNAVNHAVWIGAGTQSWKLSADLTMTRLTDAPVPLGINNAVLATDPSAGKHLIVQLYDGSTAVRRWWEFDLASDTWTRIANYDASLMMRVTRSHFQVNIPELSAIVFFSHYWSERRVWVLKYSAAAAPPPPPPPPPTGPTCIPQEYNTVPALDFCPLTSRSVCDEPGVVVCDQFDAERVGTLTPGDSRPRVEAGELVLTLPSGSGANAGGSYRVSFPPVGEGGFLAFAYRIRADAAALALPGRKEFILWRGSSSCTDLELAQTHLYTSPVVRPYTHCGARNFALPLGQYDYQIHYPDFNCTYHGMRTSLDGCAVSKADRWERYYVEVAVGKYGTPTSRVTMWQRVARGQWMRYVAHPSFVFHGSGGFDHFMLTAYMTGKKREPHPPGEVRYDWLIVSTRPLDRALL